ncbi:hypothetical protein HDV06_000465 [Boothiomyces sp. JEL0866]|nr:hypothetical protein HDV06_000465 [Boothiomyces sp. JEL0866]
MTMLFLPVVLGLAVEGNVTDVSLSESANSTIDNSNITDISLADSAINYTPVAAISTTCEENPLTTVAALLNTTAPLNQTFGPPVNDTITSNCNDTAPLPENFAGNDSPAPSVTKISETSSPILNSPQNLDEPIPTLTTACGTVGPLASITNECGPIPSIEPDSIPQLTTTPAFNDSLFTVINPDKGIVSGAHDNIEKKIHEKEELVQSQITENEPQQSQDEMEGEAKPSRKYVPGLNTAFVYSTEYSKVKVYELNWQNVPVMRRISDDYMNASNILQAAKVPKDKRKKIIKKLCSLVPFERIEEGYFKYQGVWVPLKAAKSLAERWNVYEFIKPIFDK